MVCNRAGQTTNSVLEVADKASVSKVLRIAVAPDAVLCTDGSNFLAAVAKALALEHQPVDVQSGERVRGVGVPKSTPPEVRKRLSDLFASLNADPEMKELAAKSGFELVNVGVEGVDAFMKGVLPANLHELIGFTR